MQAVLQRPLLRATGKTTKAEERERGKGEREGDEAHYLSPLPFLPFQERAREREIAENVRKGRGHRVK
jgi:hypothetical protein